MSGHHRVDGSALRDAREQHGWTRKQLSEHSGVSESWIKHVELGYKTPSRRTAHKLAKALGVNINTFSTMAPLAASSAQEAA